MKLFTLIFLIFAAFILTDSANTRVESDGERYARIILDNARVNFPCGFPDVGENGIPPIDPLLIPHMEVRQNSMGVNVISTLSNVLMRGLRFFINRRIAFNADRTVEYIFETDYKTMNGDHVTRGSMVGIPVVNGQGRMFSEMFNNVYHGVIRYTTEPGTGFIVPVSHSVNVQIQHMTMEMSGFGALNNTVNNQIRDSIPDMIASPEFQESMNEMLSAIILPMFREITYRQTEATITNHLRFLANNPAPPRC